MSNEEIITGIAISIYGEECVSKMIENGEDIPLHTLKGWAKKGPYRVKKGEHGIETRLWKKKKRNINEESEEDSNRSSRRDFYLCKSYLFKEEQVELVAE